LAVLTALEKRSQELMREKAEKLALEAKIAAMQVREAWRIRGLGGSKETCLVSAGRLS
jgi:hypothetical protein